jgi:hypothetical protein
MSFVQGESGFSPVVELRGDGVELLIHSDIVFPLRS